MEKRLLILKQPLDRFAHDPSYRHFVLVCERHQFGLLLWRQADREPVRTLPFTFPLGLSSHIDPRLVVCTMMHHRDAPAKRKDRFVPIPQPVMVSLS